MGIKVALNHLTRYRYENPTGLSPHVVRLRPTPHCRTPILAYSLSISPNEHYINWQQDPFGNYLARLVFPESTRELRVEVDLLIDLTVINPFDFFVEDYAEHFPFNYTDTARAELAPYLEIVESGNEINAWIAANRPPEGQIIDSLVTLNQALERDIHYRVRMEPGVQTVAETLSSASGSCRDSGWLLVQILRHLGLAARFVSGYLVQLTPDVKADDGPAGPSADFTDLHAWAEVYLPGAGWVGLDPTSGLFAGEGHIPLACTPLPSSAAPISGMANEPAVDFHFSNTVQRVDEQVRITKPYTESDWQHILSLGQQVDRRLDKAGLQLTVGGEPTFVSMDDMQGDEWNFTALSEKKLELASSLLLEMREAFAPRGVLSFAQGKWYPGEPTPRWALLCHWRTDGEPLWQSPDTFALPGKKGTFDRADATRFAESLTALIGVPDACLHPVYEDPLYHLHLESLLPEGVEIDQLNLKDSRARRTLAKRLSQGLDEVVGHALPLRFNAGRWESCRWTLRRDAVFLVAGDSPAGLRLPLDSIETDAEAEFLGIPEDSFTQHEPLAIPAALDASWESADGERAAQVFATALVVEWRDSSIYVFLPPLRSADAWVRLLSAVERAAYESGVAVILEGYEPPADARLKSFRITPDPGVIEVNVHPVSSFDELVWQTETLYALARKVRLSADKFLVDGRHTGTGGGNHVTLGGPSPAQSPFLNRPELLASLITYWQHHPGLSYLFSGLFIGPTSQAPRIDEARNESLYELEMALSRLPTGNSDRPWLVDRLLRNLLTDVSGNTHRVEICIDKLYSPDGPAGRQGLVELRAFEMPPHPRMAIVQGLLLRCLISRFSDSPYRDKLMRWGTALHDRFMLPHYLWRDINDVAEDIATHGMPFDPHWLDAFWEFRFPVYGTRQIGDITLELRAAMEPWYVLGEQAAAGGMSRYVDSSMERLQLKVQGLTDPRHRVSCNGRALPLRSTGTHGEYVVGVRYRAWQPPNCLHPDLPVDVPLIFDVYDTWLERSLGGCAYHAAHPGGRSHEDVPVNANVAEARRLARFDPDHHTPASTRTVVQAGIVGGSVVAQGPREDSVHVTMMPENPEYPHTADLRRQSGKAR